MESEGSKIENNIRENMLLTRNELATNPMNVTTELKLESRKLYYYFF